MLSPSLCLAVWAELKPTLIASHTTHEPHPTRCHSFWRRRSRKRNWEHPPLATRPLGANAQLTSASHCLHIVRHSLTLQLTLQLTLRNGTQSERRPKATGRSPSAWRPWTWLSVFAASGACRHLQTFAIDEFESVWVNSARCYRSYTSLHLVRSGFCGKGSNHKPYRASADSVSQLQRCWNRGSADWTVTLWVALRCDSSRLSGRMWRPCLTKEQSLSPGCIRRGEEMFECWSALRKIGKWQIKHLNRFEYATHFTQKFRFRVSVWLVFGRFGVSLGLPKNWQKLLQ